MAALRSDTPSPMKNSVGGDGRDAYGKIASDLSCPKCLRRAHRDTNEAGTSNQYARRISKLKQASMEHDGGLTNRDA